LVEHLITPTGVGTNFAGVPGREDAATPLAEVGTTIRRVRRELGLFLRGDLTTRLLRKEEE